MSQVIKAFKNKKNKILNAVVFVFFLALIFAAVVQINTVNAADAPDSVLGKLNEVGGAAKYNTDKDNIAVVVGRFIKVFLSFLGVIFIILMIYSGYLWMTAGGNAEQVEKARTNMKNAFIGLIIIVAAYAIAYFVTYFISQGDFVKDRGFN